MKLSTSLCALIGAISVSALPTITAVGNKFFDSDGKQFFMKGIAYQLEEGDPLVDTEQCKRDARLMKTLGANVIRVYHVDAKADHKGCMAAFDEAGIYTLIDLDTFDTYILPGNTYWNENQRERYAEVMDAFSQFDNALGFFVGNEIIAINNQSHTAPFIKAAARDMKAHRDAKGYRKFPIGYSAADIAELRPMLQDYLTCGGDASVNVDFFALNSYSWCDPSSYNTSGYGNLQIMAKDFPVPIFFSETGCNVPGPRLFEDQRSIFGPDMINDWSGSLIYEWIQEQNHYGLISYGPQVDPSIVNKTAKGGFMRAGEPQPVSPDFDNLKSVWATISPTGVASSAYNPSHVSTRACPASTPGGWLVDGNVRLPTLGETFTGFSQPTPGEGKFANPTSAPAQTSTRNPGTPTKQITGMGAGLAITMFIFMFWF